MNPEEFWDAVVQARLRVRMTIISSAHKGFQADPVAILLCTAMQYNIYRVSQILAQFPSLNLRRGNLHEKFEELYHSNKVIPISI